MFTILLQSNNSARTRRNSKKESLLDTIHTQQKRTHAAILKAQWSLVAQVVILIIGLNSKITIKFN